MTRELRLMSIPEVMEMAKGSVDFPNMRGELNWGEIFSAKVSDSHFDAIVDEIQAHGFGMPIVLCDRYGDGQHVIGNGHHRLAAAILLGLWRIPVIVSEGQNRDDFMCAEDSADDYARPIEGYSYEYWDMLRDNLPEGGADYGDDRDNSDGGAFYCDSCGTGFRVSDHCCQECHDAAEHTPIVEECASCGYEECRCTAVVPEMMRWNQYRWIRCMECEGYGYAVDHAKCNIAAAHSEAMRIEWGMRTWERELVNVGEFAPAIPEGMWHPENVLAEAYAEHAQWVADEPLRNARIRKENALELLSIAAKNDNSEYVLLYWAQELVDAAKAYDAL